MKLTNPNASREAVQLFEKIAALNGNILSGQQESTWMGSEDFEFDYIFEKTGKYPAVRGLDYMNDDFKGVNRRAVKWHERGGMVSVCWHCGCDFSGSWSECMNTAIPDWERALTEGTEENSVLIRGMDKAAAALTELRDRKIPVLWRPFHEFDGGWFWWGKGGAGNFRRLWQMMYRRYTEHWHLDNLIWVLGWSQNGKNYGDWYPGDDTVDIAGADSYYDGANPNLWNAVLEVTGDRKPVCFHECGKIPTPEELRNAGTGWKWFLTWHTEHILKHNDPEVLRDIYNDPMVLTLDRIQD